MLSLGKNLPQDFQETRTPPTPNPQRALMAAPQLSPRRLPLRPFRSWTPFGCSLPHLAVWEGGVSALCPAQRAQDKGGCVSTATAVPPGLGGAVPKRRSPPGTSRPCPPGALTARRGCWPGAVRMRAGSAPQQSSLWVLRLLREPAVLRLVSFPHPALSHSLPQPGEARTSARSR